MQSPGHVSTGMQVHGNPKQLTVVERNEKRRVLGVPKVFLRTCVGCSKIHLSKLTLAAVISSVTVVVFFGGSVVSCSYSNEYKLRNLTVSG